MWRVVWGRKKGSETKGEGAGAGEKKGGGQESSDSAPPRPKPPDARPPRGPALGPHGPMFFIDGKNLVFAARCGPRPRCFFLGAAPPAPGRNAAVVSSPLTPRPKENNVAGIIGKNRACSERGGDPAIPRAAHPLLIECGRQDRSETK